jgi:hypothetical protein
MGKISTVRVARRSAAAAACVVSVVVVVAIAPTASATAVATPGVRLQGQFTMAGQITGALNVKNEHRGELISRVWSLTPLCATGPCPQVRLLRTLGRGTIVINLHSTSANSYAVNSSFYAPLKCDGKINQRGELVPYTITLTITADTVLNGVTYATAITARYRDSNRLNLTHCVFPPSHDAATYTGHVAVASQ